MAWDSTRKVPWKRLTKEWLVYLVIILVIFGLFFSDSVNVGTFLGLALSGPLYVGFGGLMAKFGYERQKLIRSPRASQAITPSTPQRSRPAPTSRTGGHKGNKRR